MTQTAAVLSKIGALHIELPDANAEMLPGVRWGAIDAFPTPAYWAYQVLAKRVFGDTPKYKLGRTLTEEVGACLLGGHGIPATVGLAAFVRLRSWGAFEKNPPSESQLLAWLEQPLELGGKTIRYRFARQKAHYLGGALGMLQDPPTTDNGRVLRDWLLRIPGIGYKTASWIARNWLHADDVAILDVHILRLGRAIGLFPNGLTVERHYLDLEKLFLKFSKEMCVRPSELDAVIWCEMASSPRSVRQLMESHPASNVNAVLLRTNKRHAGAEQLSLVM